MCVSSLYRLQPHGQLEVAVKPNATIDLIRKTLLKIWILVPLMEVASRPPNVQYGTRATYDICGHNDERSTDRVLIVDKSLSRTIADDAVIGELDSPLIILVDLSGSDLLDTTSTGPTVSQWLSTGKK